MLSEISNKIIQFPMRISKQITTNMTVYTFFVGVAVCVQENKYFLLVFMLSLIKDWDETTKRTRTEDASMTAFVIC